MSTQKRPGSPLSDRDAKRVPPFSPPNPMRVIPAVAVPFMRGLSLNRLWEADLDGSSLAELQFNGFGLLQRVGENSSAADREHAAVSNFVFQWKSVLATGDIPVDEIPLRGNVRLGSARTRGLRLDAISIGEDLLPCEDFDREEDLSHIMALTGFDGRDLLTAQEEVSARPPLPIVPGLAMAPTESWSKSIDVYSSSEEEEGGEVPEEGGGEEEEPDPHHILHGVEYAGEELDLAVYFGPAGELTEGALWELEMDEEALAPDMTGPEEVEEWMEEMLEAKAEERDFVS